MKNGVTEILKERKPAVQTRAAILAVFPVSISAVAYLPMLGHTFHSWDDDAYVTSNQRVIKGLNGDNVIGTDELPLRGRPQAAA